MKPQNNTAKLTALEWRLTFRT